MRPLCQNSRQINGNCLAFFSLLSNPNAFETKKAIPSVMGEGLVGFCHLVGSLSFSQGKLVG
jgi:hypothetical protein